MLTDAKMHHCIQKNFTAKGAGRILQLMKALFFNSIKNNCQIYLQPGVIIISLLCPVIG